MVHILKTQLPDWFGFPTKVLSSKYKKGSTNALGIPGQSIEPINTKHLPSAHQDHQASSQASPHFPTCWQLLDPHLYTEYMSPDQFCLEEQALQQYFLMHLHHHCLPFTAINVYKVQHTILGTSHVSHHLLFSKTLGGRTFCDFHFTNAETEAHRDEVSCSRSHCLLVSRVHSLQYQANIYWPFPLSPGLTTRLPLAPWVPVLSFSSS